VWLFFTTFFHAAFTGQNLVISRDQSAVLNYIKVPLIILKSWNRYKASELTCVKYDYQWRIWRALHVFWIHHHIFQKVEPHIPPFSDHPIPQERYWQHVWNRFMAEHNQGWQ
jgi:hypothetical protein